MTKQSINLLGGLVVIAILVVGLLFGALPHWQQASQAHDERDRVAGQNQAQQAMIGALARQRAQLPTLQQQVAALKQQIAPGQHLEQLIDLASNLPAGAVLRSIAPADAAAQAGASASPTAAATGAAGSTTSMFSEVPVVMVIGLANPGDAAKVLDKLRSGPRLLAIDEAKLAADASAATKASAYTLTVSGRVFMSNSPEPSTSPSATSSAAPQPTQGSTP